jgi:hypothetical protein
MSATDPVEPIASPDFLDAGLAPLADFARRIGRLDAALMALERLAGGAAARSVVALRQELAQFEPAVTILGQVKSGKTTLVNAMAGQPDLLPSDVNPWTSVVTSLHLIPGTRRHEVGAKFQLMKEEEWDRLLQRGGRLGELAQRSDAAGELERIRAQIQTMRDKSRRRLGRKFELLLGQVHEYGYFDRNLLERYVCLGDDVLDEDAEGTDGKQGWFADITRAADLYLHNKTVPIPLCLRDTPGVNDTFLMREQVTIGAVRDSRVCLVVLSASQALTSVDMGLIRLISALKSRDVIIFVNRIDELQNPAEQVGEIERSIRETLDQHKGPSEARIIFGSAYWANRALAERIDDITPASAAALVNWAEHRVGDADPEPSPTELVWQLSGLPELYEVIAAQIVASLGNPLLRRIASAAVTIAGSLQAAQSVRVSATAPATPAFDLPGATRALDELSRRHIDDLTRRLDDLTLAYRERADRAHASFLERATHSLVRHLEDYGEGIVWEYDPTGLRLLLKSAYSVYAARAQSTANAAYRAAVEDVAEFLYTAFGDAVEGIELSLPEAPEAPAPVALAQTIILDFNDGWWVSWWRRTRGYKAFAEKFHGMIAAETRDFMAQFKMAPPVEYNGTLEATLSRFLGQARDIVAEIGASQAGASQGGKDRLQSLAQAGDARARRIQIDDLLAELRLLVEQSQAEAA